MRFTIGRTFSLNKTERGRNPMARWARKKKLRQDLAWEITVAAADAGNPLPPIELRSPDVRMRLTLTLYRARRFDPDNAHGGAKILIDAMRDLALLKNDSPKWLDLRIEQVLEKDKAKERTEVELTPADNPTGGAQ